MTIIIVNVYDHKPYWDENTIKKLKCIIISDIRNKEFCIPANSNPQFRFAGIFHCFSLKNGYNKIRIQIRQKDAVWHIERAITPVFKRRAASSKCVLVTGARQVGKSTLIKHEFQNYHRVNFDDRLTRLQAREEPKLYFPGYGTCMLSYQVADAGYIEVFCGGRKYV